MHIKLFFSMLMLTALSVAATAQSLTLGVKAGSSTTSFRGDYTYSTSNLYDNSKINSLVLTEYLNYKLTSTLSVQAELSYQKKGFEYKTKRTVVDYVANGNAEFGYLQIPILLQYSYGNKLKVFANGGPSINIIVSDGMYKYFYVPDYGPTVNFAPVQPSEGIVNIKSDFNKVTLGIVGSAGVSYDITSTIGILGEFRVGYDLTKSAKDKAMESLPQVAPHPGYNTYYSPLITYDKTHFLSYTIQGGVYFRLGQ